MTREQLLSRAVGTRGGTRGYKLGFPMTRNSATFWNKGTEVPSLAWDKGTTRKFKIFPQDGTGQDSQSKSRTGHGTGQLLYFCQNSRRYSTPRRSIRPSYGPQFPSLLARGNYCYGDMYFVKQRINQYC